MVVFTPTYTTFSRSFANKEEDTLWVSSSLFHATRGKGLERLNRNMPVACFLPAGESFGFQTHPVRMWMKIKPVCSKSRLFAHPLLFFAPSGQPQRWPRKGGTCAPASRRVNCRLTCDRFSVIINISTIWEGRFQ